MSEVKPTLVFYEGAEGEVPTNSWLSNFPTGRWIDARDRGWYWIIINFVNFVGAYEYRVKFDNPTENITLIFPFVVKTSDIGIKKVFIDGVKYQVRNKENYGNMFVVSGQEFKFKVATKYKLSKQTVPILAVEYKQAIFKNVEFLDLSYIEGLRTTSGGFYTTNKITTDYITIRTFYPNFIASNFIACGCIRIRTTSSVFNNVNSFSASVIANCRDTSWTRFGGIWSSCDTWIPLT
jgi:hypothetical protein